METKVQPDLLQTLRDLARTNPGIREILMAHRRGKTSLETAAAEAVVYLSIENERLQSFQDSYARALRECRGESSDRNTPRRR